MKRTVWTDEEVRRLKEICKTEIDGKFPGYKYVAEVLNNEYKNNRSVASCRNMSLLKKEFEYF